MSEREIYILNKDVKERGSSAPPSQKVKYFLQDLLLSKSNIDYHEILHATTLGGSSNSVALEQSHKVTIRSIRAI